MYDLNDAQPQMAPLGELIPDGTFAKIRLTIRPGGINGATSADAGLLKASQTSDAKMLDCEFTVVDGPYARRKFWQNFTVAGGKVDEKGVSKGWNISKSMFRAMVDSALNLKPDDMSDSARQKRTLTGLKQLDGIVFAARLMIEPSSNPSYQDANKLANVVLPDEPHYDAIMRGESVPADPINAKPRKSVAASSDTPPAWQRPSTPSSSSAPQSTPSWSGQAAKPATQATSPLSGPAWLNG